MNVFGLPLPQTLFPCVTHCNHTDHSSPLITISTRANQTSLSHASTHTHHQTPPPLNLFPTTTTHTMSPSPFNYPEETRPFIFAKTLAFPIQLETDLGVLRLPAPAAPKMEDGNEKRLWYLEALYFRRWDGKLSHVSGHVTVSHTSLSSFLHR